MRTLIAAGCAALLLIETTGLADAAGSSTGGSAALVLAALVGLQSPNVSAVNKHALGDMATGLLGFASDAPITVKADQVSCRASDVDISAHDCAFTFGAIKRTLKGRAAHEVYATLIENGVASDGAAGSIFEAVSHLVCIVKPAEVKQRGGGGADCTFSPGP